MDPILEILEQNAKATPEDIARMTGLSPAQVAESVKRYEQEKIILRYKTVLNREILKDESHNEDVRALIEVKIVPQRDKGFDGVAERIYNFPEVKSCYLLSGGYDLLLVVEGKTLSSVANFVAQKLACLEHVRATATHFLLRKYKEDGDVLSSRAFVDARLPVVP